MQKIRKGVQRGRKTMFDKRCGIVKTLALVLCITILTTMLPLQSFAKEAEREPVPLTDSLDPTDSKEPESRILEELPEKRDAYSKRFVTENKSEIAAVYSVPVHYEKNGEWEEINNTPVSYTHLDVYKRQRIFPGPASILSAARPARCP